MATSSPFNYNSLYSQLSVPVVRGENRHAKYDFAVAYPDPETLPLEGLADSLKVALEREGKDLALYPVAAGLPALREWVAEKLARDRNMNVGVDDIVLTSGSGEAISMLIAALTDPGDVLLTEEYVYLGTLRAMRRFGADVRSVKCDDEGLIPEDLESTLATVAAEGKKVKFLYTIPAFQNPLGWTMSLERRVKTLEITGKYGVPVLEDDCYVDLRFEGEDVTSMHSMDDSGRVLYVGSFSKIVAPGVRLGYMVAPQEVIQRAMSFKGGGGVNQFAALAVQEFAKDSMYSHIQEQNDSLRVKRDAMLAALGENFGDAAQWSKPEGGLYVWLEMPEDIDLAAFQEQSFNEGVGYYNGTMFSPEGRGANCARLCFGHPTAETVSEGVAEMARIFERHGVLKG
ncbi:Aromatic-amino-acid aminotransferase 1 [Geodia barretti]|uniref:Aromatic-amino-acid aminotransferase 1 n=1 Tax=Geodia barretti TaxID=519541 RepID=A0AA35RPW9_GEOBA|nr:Aromatic-amino-acid aminotransferase 1 [Geodia barretti]